MQPVLSQLIEEIKATKVKMSVIIIIKIIIRFLYDLIILLDALKKFHGGHYDQKRITFHNPNFSFAGGSC
jgi:hypothetical protein